MGSLGPVDSLPNELLHKCFTGLPLDSLKRALLVCKRWQQVAMNHPTYWRSVSLDDASHNAFTTFEARLGYGRGRPMIVRVAFTVDVEALSATILAAVAAHSFHIFDLTLNVPIDLADAVFSALRNDMPILRRLTIRLSSDSSELAVPDLPHDLIYKCASSGIRYLELSNIRIPLGPLPTLPTVISLNYDLPPAPHDEALGSMFPNLRTLLLGGEFVEEYHRSCIGFCSSVSFLQFGSSLTEVVSSLSLASVPHVAVPAPPAHIAQALFNHLDGDLEAHLVDSGGSIFRVIVVSRLSSYARNFIEGKQDYSTVYEPLYLFEQPSFFERVTHLSISPSVWDMLVVRYPSFPGITALGICAGRNQEDLAVDVSAHLECPRLRTLSLWTASMTSRVDLTQVQVTMRRVLVGVTYPLMLHIGEDITLLNDRDGAGDVFVRTNVNPFFLGDITRAGSIGILYDVYGVA